MEPHYTGQSPLPLALRHPIRVVLDSVRSAFNVGSIFRTADAAAVEHIYLCGLTGWPPNPKILKTSLGSHSYVPWSRQEFTRDALRQLKAEGIPIIGLEVHQRSRTMAGFAWPRPVALVLGHEVVGLDDEVLEMCDDLVRIPMFGHKNSINVATAFGIAAFDILRTWG